MLGQKRKLEADEVATDFILRSDESECSINKQAGLGWQWMSRTPRPRSLSDPDEYDEHNIWNPMLELLCHAHIGVFMEALVDEEDLGRIAFSCHFALDILCDKR